MSTPAQVEFDSLFNDGTGDKSSTHPEDRSETSSDHDGTTLHSSIDDDQTSATRPPIMPSATFIPTTTQFDANTGPKGVIADARSFETAKKRSFRQTLYAFASGESPPLFSKNNKFNFNREKSKSPSPDVSDEEDDFMRSWRVKRLDELASMNQDIRTRRQSPSKRRYGSLVIVDPSGYLDAVERVSAETVVVVLIYDDEVSARPFYESHFPHLAD